MGGRGSGYPLTQEEIALIATGKYSSSDLSRMLGRASATASRHAKRLGIILPNKSKVHTCNELYFDTWTVDSAYWLGFIAADGNINQRCNRLTISVAERDADHLYKFKTALLATQYIRGSRRVLNGKVYFSCVIAISSPSLCSSLVKLGIVPRKSLTLRWNKSIPADLVSHYVRGYYDGDGSITVVTGDGGHPCITILGTREVCEAIKQRFDVVYKKSIGRVAKRSGSKVHFLYYHGNLCVPAFLDWIYDGSSPRNRLTRKYELAKEVWH